MICGTCNEFTHRIRVRFDDGIKSEICDRCGDVGKVGLPDVFWPGHAHYNPNITDNMGKEILLTSRNHKARVMKEQRMSEAGDAYHGSKQGAYKHL